MVAIKNNKASQQAAHAKQANVSGSMKNNESQDAVRNKTNAKHNK